MLQKKSLNKICIDSEARPWRFSRGRNKIQVRIERLEVVLAGQAGAMKSAWRCKELKVTIKFFADRAIALDEAMRVTATTVDRARGHPVVRTLIVTPATSTVF